MFTGLITDIGKIIDIVPLNSGIRLKIETAYDPRTIEMGASISCSGICLTVTGLPPRRLEENWFMVEAWEEALRLTTIETWQKGRQINLERSLKIGDELGGHMVSGHVDGLTKIIELTKEGDAMRFHLEIPEGFAGFIAPKCSIALDGTSLTVNQLDGDMFDVLLIRHSLDVTTWGARQKGDDVNFEIDPMARYMARLFACNRQLVVD